MRSSTWSPLVAHLKIDACALRLFNLQGYLGSCASRHECIQQPFSILQVLPKASNEALAEVIIEHQLHFQLIPELERVTNVIVLFFCVPPTQTSSAIQLRSEDELWSNWSLSKCYRSAEVISLAFPIKR